MQFQAINHAGITVSDMERSMRFYTEVLGLEFDSSFERDSQGRLVGANGPSRSKIVFLRTSAESGTKLELIQITPAMEPIGDLDTRRPGSSHICFETGDLVGDFERLSRLGVEFVSEPVPMGEDGGWLVYMKDPDGVRIELVEWPDPAANR